MISAVTLTIDHNQELTLRTTGDRSAILERKRARWRDGEGSTVVDSLEAVAVKDRHPKLIDGPAVGSVHG